MAFIFVRHAPTILNVNNKLQGSGTNEHILPEYISAVEELKNKLKQYNYNEVYASDSNRAIQTAKIFNENVKVDKRLNEPNFGIFDGMDHGEVQKHSIYKEWTDDKWNYNKNGIEPWINVYTKVMDFIDEKDNVLCVTHATLMKILYLEYKLKEQNKSLKEYGSKINWYQYRKIEPYIKNLDYFVIENMKIIKTNLIEKSLSLKDILF